MRELKYDSQKTPEEMLHQDQHQRESFNRITQDVINIHDKSGVELPKLDKITECLLLYYHDLGFHAGLSVGLNVNKKE